MSVYLAIDLGAGSGRVMAISHDATSLSLELIHRFESPAVEENGHLSWDLDLILSEIQIGLGLAGQTYGTIQSIGVDSWGVDYAWFNKQGALLSQPHCYRDPRTEGLVEDVCALLGRDVIFEETGIQFMPINTLYQLRADGELPEEAARFLMIADVINYWLTGRMVCERTNASTSQLYNPRTRSWSEKLASGLKLPTSVLPPLIDPGQTVGLVKNSEVPVIAVGSHDTASAVAGVPATSESFAYLSCGTWALLGTEISEPMIADAVLNHNFTNETGVADTFRLLKNINGLWIVQECRRVWQESDGQEISFDELAALTEAAPSFQAFIDPDDPSFANRGDHPKAIQVFCEQSAQSIPTSRGDILRVALESLALKVATTLDQLETLLLKRLDVLHVIGGGVNDRLLMQSIANAIERRVIAGPTEATALGNALVQMIASGAIDSLASGRALLAKAIPTTIYEPNAYWESARQRFQRMLESEHS
ncbi:MAG: rhamnulokinase [Verrucomicrobiales bacterium]|jgi:rhamnulokinase